ncbi:DNA polymerase III subunit gamma/tau [Bacillus kwashiorkori]|uniref:DNA polymerase III subunit gamma/tau n=1 Tax=Bacillus kwashiorkori TaxID=1522318 RepID=UPI0007822E5E|nr:DNA polymerase III subunit gamma/tau [Bacillus kwashiorkori]
MSYQALYRVWRPQIFADVVGQSHVTKTLQNALIQEKISHAYLFSGPRGTGKTSAAKILAKAVNCPNSVDGEPCNECPSCKGITDGSIPDVIEFDAASNSRVEEMRDVLDKVKFAPSATKYKVYIIDEVHMLSISAFNALLKTLEEPPKHVIFVLATTEPHKIPLTIISRCQRFDFKRITSSTIVERLRLILHQSGQAYDEEAIQVIARTAEGGMRDALSLLDQTLSYSSEKITLEDALMITGSVSQQVLSTIVKAILHHNSQEALKWLHKLIAEGKDVARLVEDLLLYYRDLLLYKSSPDLVEYLEKVIVDDDFIENVEGYTDDRVYQIIDQLNKTQQEMKWTNHPRIFLEVSLIQLCETEKVNNQEDSNKINHLLEKLSQLETELQQLKEAGPVNTSTQEQAPKSQRSPARQGNSFKVPTGKIERTLSDATKQNLQIIKTNWANVLTQLKRSHSALLNDAEPVAASDSGLIIKFKYEIHCQMAMQNQEFISIMKNVLATITGKQLEVIGVPEEQWMEIRSSFISQHRQQIKEEDKQPNDPLIEEAKRLVGEELLEIKD